MIWPTYYPCGFTWGLPNNQPIRRWKVAMEDTFVSTFSVQNVLAINECCSLTYWRSLLSKQTDKVAQLCAMGFDTDSATSALSKARNDLTDAVNLLLSDTSPDHVGETQGPPPYPTSQSGVGEFSDVPSSPTSINSGRSTSWCRNSTFFTTRTFWLLIQVQSFKRST